MSRNTLFITLLVLSAIPACASIPSGGATAAGAASPGRTTGDPQRPTHTVADVAFMHGMTMHHAQALVMTALVPTRASSEQVKLMAQRIELSQRDELARIERWLRRRGEPVAPPADEHAAHTGGGDHAMHPGMLAPAEIQRLGEATGTAFDRLFLEYMIRHHQGALEMVSTLFATEGAGQESETFQFASEVDSDQRVEISRMRVILESLP